MGGKTSKAIDIFVPENCKYCELSDEALKKYSGGPYEYMAVDVCLNFSNTKDENPPTNSIISILPEASRKNFCLCYVTPKKTERSTDYGKRLLWTEEQERKIQNNGSNPSTTHTAVFSRARLSANVQKQQSLERMDAQKTILNVVMEMNNRSATFYIKDFTTDISDISSGVESLQKLISSEADNGSKLQSVVRLFDEDVNTLHLQLIFMLGSNKDEQHAYEYNVETIKINYTESKLKLSKKKHPVPKSNRLTNITCHNNWLKLLKKNCKLIEVINVDGSLPATNHSKSASKSNESKSKKSTSFDTTSILIYEKPLRARIFEGLVREVWNPIDETLHENIKNETTVFGEYGWELSTLICTLHVRMKPDGTEHRKCLLFFQRKCPISESLSALLNKKEESENESIKSNGKTVSSPSSEKVKHLGMGAITQDELTQAKLRHAHESKEDQKIDKEVNILSKVQLKKVNKDQVKDQQLVDGESQEQSVPWHASLERKREAVMRNEMQRGLSDEQIPKPTDAEQAIVQKLEEIKSKNFLNQAKDEIKIEKDIPFIDKDDTPSSSSSSSSSSDDDDDGDCDNQKNKISKFITKAFVEKEDKVICDQISLDVKESSEVTLNTEDSKSMNEVSEIEKSFSVVTNQVDDDLIKEVSTKQFDVEVKAVADDDGSGFLVEDTSADVNSFHHTTDLSSEDQSSNQVIVEDEKDIIDLVPIQDTSTPSRKLDEESEVKNSSDYEQSSIETISEMTRSFSVKHSQQVVVSNSPSNELVSNVESSKDSEELNKALAPKISEDEGILMSDLSKDTLQDVEDVHVVATFEYTGDNVEQDLKLSSIPTSLKPELIIEESVKHIEEPDQSIQKPAVPSLVPASTEPKPAEPFEEPAEIELEPTEPLEEPAVIEPKPTEPLEEPAVIEPKPIELFEEPAEIELEPTEPLEEPPVIEPKPTEPFEEPAVIELEPTESLEEPAEIELEPTEPLEEPAITEPEPVVPFEEPMITEPEQVVPFEESAIKEPEPIVPFLEPASTEPKLVVPLEELSITESEPVSSLEVPTITEPDPAVPFKEPTITEPQLVVSEQSITDSKSAVPFEESVTAEPIAPFLELDSAEPESAVPVQEPTIIEPQLEVPLKELTITSPEPVVPFEKPTSTESEPIAPFEDTTITKLEPAASSEPEPAASSEPEPAASSEQESAASAEPEPALLVQEIAIIKPELVVPSDHSTITESEPAVPLEKSAITNLKPAFEEAAFICSSEDGVQETYKESKKLEIDEENEFSELDKNDKKSIIFEEVNKRLSENPEIKQVMSISVTNTEVFSKSVTEDPQKLLVLAASEDSNEIDSSKLKDEPSNNLNKTVDSDKSIEDFKPQDILVFTPSDVKGSSIESVDDIETSNIISEAFPDPPQDFLEENEASPQTKDVSKDNVCIMNDPLEIEDFKEMSPKIDYEKEIKTEDKMKEDINPHLLNDLKEKEDSTEKEENDNSTLFTYHQLSEAVNQKKDLDKIDSDDENQDKLESVIENIENIACHQLQQKTQDEEDLLSEQSANSAYLTKMETLETEVDMRSEKSQEDLSLQNDKTNDCSSLDLVTFDEHVEEQTDKSSYSLTKSEEIENSFVEDEKLDDFYDSSNDHKATEQTDFE